MKINLIFIFLLLCFSFQLKAQWSVKYIGENGSSTWNNIVKFKSDSLGLFMGDHSVILKSTDAGETWNSAHSNTVDHLYNFQFIDDSCIYAIGNQYNETKQQVTSKLIKSIDNGDSWDSITSFPGKQFWSLSFLDENTGMVAGYDGIYRTSNSGKTWDTVWSAPQFGYEFGELKQICFPNSQFGYAIGIGYHHFGMPDNFLLKTTDSGITWDTISTLKENLTVQYFINADTGFVGTEPGILYKTTDGGHTWTDKIITEFWNGISSIQFISDQIGFVVGHQRIITGGMGATSFFISKTIDSGETWKTFNSSGLPLNSIYFLNDSIGFVSGAYSLIMKTKGKIDELPADYPWHLVDDGLDVKDIDDTNSLVKVFPNPTTGLLNLQFKNTTQSIGPIRLINTSGQIIDFKIPKTAREAVQLDLAGFPSGIYLLRISSPGGNSSLKVIKK